MAFALAAERDKRQLGCFRERCVVGLSSGTSGNRGLHLTDRAISRRLPCAFLARSGVALRPLPFRIAFLLRVFSPGGTDINGPLVSLHHLHTMLPIDEAIDRLNALRANVLTGAASIRRAGGPPLPHRADRGERQALPPQLSGPRQPAALTRRGEIAAGCGSRRRRNRPPGSGLSRHLVRVCAAGGGALA